MVGTVEVGLAAPPEGEHRGGDYLSVADLKEMFGCGDSKAHLMMQALPTSVRIGTRDYVLRSDLNDYLREHGGITCKWPKRKKRR